MQITSVGVFLETSSQLLALPTWSQPKSMAEEVDARQAVMSTCLEASSTPRDMSPAREGLREVGDSAGTWNGPSVCFAAGWMPLELCWVPETVAGGCAQRHWQRGLAGKAEHRALSCPGGRSDGNSCVILALAFVIALGQWGGVAMWLL